MQQALTVWTTYSTTKVYLATCSHTWTLCNYEDLLGMAKQKEVYSDYFYVERELPEGGREEFTFYLTAMLSYKYGDDDLEDDGNIWISINYVEFEVKVFKFGFLNKDGSDAVGWKKGQLVYSDSEKCWVGGRIAIPRDTIESDKDNLLLDGCLRLKCLVEVLSGCPQESSVAAQSINTAMEMSDGTLGKDFANLLDNKILSDVQLICEGVRFDCHRVVLAARSDVFSAMFSHKGTKEAATNTIDITDSTPDHVCQLINFLYTDKCDEMEDHALGLLHLADKYNLPRLKVICESWMANDIRDDNAVDTLLLADMHGATNLTAIALNYVTENLDNVKTTSGWERIKKDCPGILAKLMETVSPTGFPNSANQIIKRLNNVN